MSLSRATLECLDMSRQYFLSNVQKRHSRVTPKGPNSCRGDAVVVLWTLHVHLLISQFSAAHTVELIIYMSNDVIHFLAHGNELVTRLQSEACLQNAD